MIAQRIAGVRIPAAYISPYLHPSAAYAYFEGLEPSYPGRLFCSGRGNDHAAFKNFFWRVEMNFLDGGQINPCLHQRLMHIPYRAMEKDIVRDSGESGEEALR